jgi:hypothetical protein
MISEGRNPIFPMTIALSIVANFAGRISEGFFIPVFGSGSNSMSVTSFHPVRVVIKATVISAEEMQVQAQVEASFRKDP